MISALFRIWLTLSAHSNSHELLQSLSKIFLIPYALKLVLKWTDLVQTCLRNDLERTILMISAIKCIAINSSETKVLNFINLW